MIQIDFDAVHRLATVGSLVESMRRAFSSNAISPERAHYDLEGPNHSRTLLLMPSWRPQGALGVKITTVFPENAERNIPTVNAAYLLLSWETGQPLAMIDGRALTLLRTAAVSALAADLLAPSDPEVLLMVGTGALSRYLIEGHLAVRKYKSALVWGRNPKKAAAVAQDLNRRGWPVSVAADLEAAASSADVISCATLAEQPLIKGAWLKPQVHVDLVGSYTPAMREADDECMRGAFIVVDTLGGLEKSGDLIQPLARGVIGSERITLLNDLIMQWPKIPRAPTTVFKSVGVAHADLAAAEELLGRTESAIRLGT